MTDGRFGTARGFARPPATPVETRVPFSFVHINKCGGSGVEIALGLVKSHMTAAQMRAVVGEKNWADRFTFSIVRNPFARVVSIYFYRVRTQQTLLGDRHLNINQWIDRVWNDQDPRYLADPILTAPCCDWLVQDGVLLVDEVLQLERLGQDWDRVAERLGVQARPGLTNNNSHPPYRDLLDPTSRQTLERAFAADMDRFGYRY